MPAATSVALAPAGVHPFGSRSGQEWFQRVQSATPDLSGLPPVLYEVVRWSLTRNPQDRPSAAELAVICAGRR